MESDSLLELFPDQNNDERWVDITHLLWKLDGQCDINITREGILIRPVSVIHGTGLTTAFDPIYHSFDHVVQAQTMNTTPFEAPFEPQDYEVLFEACNLLETDFTISTPTFGTELEHPGLPDSFASRTHTQQDQHLEFLPQYDELSDLHEYGWGLDQLDRISDFDYTNTSSELSLGMNFSEPMAATGVSSQQETILNFLSSDNHTHFESHAHQDQILSTSTTNHDPDGGNILPRTKLQHTTSKHKPHTCNLCGRAFRRVSDLIRHAHIHYPGQRRYPCLEMGCDKTGKKGFYRKDKLLVHQRTIHGIHV